MKTHTRRQVGNISTRNIPFPSQPAPLLILRLQEQHQRTCQEFYQMCGMNIKSPKLNPADLCAGPSTASIGVLQLFRKRWQTGNHTPSSAYESNTSSSHRDVFFGCLFFGHYNWIYRIKLTTQTPMKRFLGGQGDIFKKFKTENVCSFYLKMMHQL